jgi:8-oxo-dGTP pyrophosphatase MutT (NUDIX family)
MRRWTLERSRVLLDRPWLRVHEECLVLPSGARIEEFHRLETPSWAAAVALTNTGEIVLVEQHRRGLDGTSLELPAGVIDNGESAEDAVKRELLEETGYAADEWLPLCELAPEPSRSTARAHLFFARNAYSVSEPRPEACEQIQVVRLAASQALQAAETGRIQHAVHVAALFLAARRGWI